jgi:CubicO group peptidase (beta-lactamase class C family)
MLFQNKSFKFLRILSFLAGILAVIIFSGSRAGIKNNQVSDDLSNKIDSFIQKVIKETNYKAGFSVSIVQGNKILFSKGYGYRNVEKKLPLTDETPIYIASATKSFVGTAAKILADEDVLDLDAPISNYLPALKFNSPLSARTISIRDLLTHRSGIGNIPVVLRTAFTGDQTDSLILKLFEKSIFKGHSFRYTNLGYVLTGLIIKKVTGKSWQNVLEEKIFKPLGMNSTHAYVSSYKESDLAQPYTVSDGKAEKLEYIKDDKTMHAAGGIITTAKDAANWLKFNVNNGKFNGRQIVSERSMNEMHSAQIDLSKTFYNYKRFAYGLGWYLSDYNSDLLIHHFGGYAGFRSHISFMPKYKVGVAGFVNDEGEGFFLPDLVADYAYNLLSGKNDADRIAEKEYSEYKDKISKSRKKAAENKNVVNLLSEDDMKNFTGTYYNEDYGTMEISIKGKTLAVKIGNLEGRITEPKKELLLAYMTAFKSKVEFETNRNDNKVISISLVSIPWPDYKFIKTK